MQGYFIGLMSGTSLDGIDAALILCRQDKVQFIEGHYQTFSSAFRELLKANCFGDSIHLESLGTLDARLGVLFAECALRLLEKSRLKPSQIRAIGCHGQTLHHNPTHSSPYSLQIGDPNRIAELTGITTIADFRRRDIAAGGQGAPLVPAFHRALLQNGDENRVIVNLGGIANITTLPKDLKARIWGFDTGPGNTLLDHWAARHLKAPMDTDGNWGKSGRLSPALLEAFLKEPYFTQPAPKSTGQEYFSPAWLEGKLTNFPGLAPEDVQASLCHLCAITVADAIRCYAPQTDRVLACGGGVHNKFLLELLGQRLNCPVETTERHGIHPDWVEATAFAWLAKRTLEGQCGNLPDATGARSAVILGGLYPGRFS